MRVIVEFDMYSRLGNRMFQYAFGYLLAKKYNCNLYCKGDLPNFGIKGNSNFVNFDNQIENTSDQIIYTRHGGAQYFDFNALENFDGDVVVNSWLQKADYYTEHRELLRELFDIQKLEPVNKDCLVLHVRGGDYITIGCHLDYRFYKRLIDHTKFTKVAIVTDDPNCDTVRRLVNDGCQVLTPEPAPFNVNGDVNAMNDLKTLLYSENIAISQSSFAWWAAFLGYHKKVIIPFSTDLDTLMWHIDPQQDDIDLCYDDPGVVEKYIHQK